MFGVYYFVFMNIKSKNEHISNLKNELDSRAKKQQSMISITHQINDAEQNISLVNNSIVASDGDVKFIESLEALAHDDNLSIKINSLSLNDDPKLASSNMTIFDISADTSGSFFGTYKLLSEIESLPYKVKIVSFVLQTSAADGVFNTKKTGEDWNGKFEINVLKYK
jgi:hypothetical protein